MAKVKLTEEEANAKYQEGYNDGRSGPDFSRDLADIFIEPFVDLAMGAGNALFNAATLGFFEDELISEAEKERRLDEIYDAGYEQGQKDAQEYGEKDDEG